MALLMLHSSLSMAVTLCAPHFSARIARTPVPVPKSKTDLLLKSNAFHCLHHQMGSGMMTGSKTHFRCDDNIVFNAWIRLDENRPGSNKIRQCVTGLKSDFPFCIPIFVLNY